MRIPKTSIEVGVSSQGGATGRDVTIIMDPEETSDELICQTLQTTGTPRVPKLGYWNVISKNPVKELTDALSAGYRHVVLDSRLQREDVSVGQALSAWLKESGSGREELFVTLMMDISQQRPLASAQLHIIQRLQELDIDYIDMVVAHKSDGMSIGDNLRQRNAILSMWKGLEKLVSDGRTKCLALGDFRQDEVEVLLASCQVKPGALWFTQAPDKLAWKSVDQTRRYCQYRGLLMGVLPRLDRPESEWVRTVCPALTPVARKLERTPLQVFQRYHIQKNILVSVAVDSRLVHSSFRAFDFHLPQEDLDQLQNIPL